MKWKQTVGGIALVQDNKIIGWVTTTINGLYLFGLDGQASNQKEKAQTKSEAKEKLVNLAEKQLA
jgi:hypothetical protein